MGGKSVSTDNVKSLGDEMIGYGRQETLRLMGMNDFNYYGDGTYPGSMGRGDYLSDLTRGNADALSAYGQNVISPTSDISSSAQGTQYYGDFSATAGAGLYDQGMALGNQHYSDGISIGNNAYNQGMGIGNTVYSQGLSQGADSMNQANAFISSLGGMAGSISQPSISLGSVQNGSVQNGTTAAGGNAQDYHNEYMDVYAPAARQQLADAQNYNTAAYREYLAQQAAGNAARSFQNAQGQNARTMASMGWQPGSGAMASMQQQAALASAAQQAAQGTDAAWQAEQEGWRRVNEAMNNQAGAHLISGANDALGIEAGVTNANTAAQASVANSNTAAQASVANANTAAQASLASSWLGSQATLGAAQMSAASSAFNAGLDARSNEFATGAQGLQAGYNTGVNAQLQGYQTGAQSQMQGYQLGGQALLQGYNQASNSYRDAGSLYNNAGELSIDAQRAANESANTSLGLYMTPREQYYQNHLMAVQPEMWGLTNKYNAYLGANQIEAGNASNESGLFGSVIGAAGTAAGGYLSTLSDRRLKQNIVRIGTYDNGLSQYEFAYKDDPTMRYRGVMADEVEKFMPEAVIVGQDGYQRVNYALLGIEMEKV